MKNSSEEVSLLENIVAVPWICQPKLSREAQAKKCLSARGHIIYACMYINLMVLFPFAFCKHRDLFSIEVRQAWGAGFSDQHLSCLRSYSSQREHLLSLETWDGHGEEGKRAFLDTLLSSQSYVCEPRNLKARVTAPCPSIPIWHLFLTRELQRDSALPKIGSRPRLILLASRLSVCSNHCYKCGSAEHLVKYFPIAPATSPV